MTTKIGRPSLLDVHGLTEDDLLRLYEKFGTYRRLAEHLNTTTRTLTKYLHGVKSRGRPRRAYSSRARLWIEHHLELLRQSDKEVIATAAADGLSPTYMRKVLQSKRRRVESVIRRRIRATLHAQSAIRDTKGRLIPTAAIKYVWIPRWSWDKPAYMRVVLRDGTRSKLLSAYTPTLADAAEPATIRRFSGHSDSPDQ